MLLVKYYSSAQENALQKYKRLRFEVSSFMDELNRLSQRDDQDENFVLKGVQNFNIENQTKLLGKELDYLSKDEDLKAFLDENYHISSVQKTEEKISEQLFKEIASMKEKKHISPITTQQPPPVQAQSEPKQQEDVKQRALELEKRIANLERVIGVANAPQVRIILHRY
jgi:hypothetical protein